MRDLLADTGDSTWNAATIQAIDWQAGTDGTFMPQNQTKDEGNDDQVFWAYASMSAAELKFPAPATGYPSWAAQAQAVFNLQAERWDDTTCDGGLRWQIISLNNGYVWRPRCPLRSEAIANGVQLQLQEHGIRTSHYPFERRMTFAR